MLTNIALNINFLGHFAKTSMIRKKSFIKLGPVKIDDQSGALSTLLRPLTLVFSLLNEFTSKNFINHYT
jgi:hypothetical protein